MSCFYPFDPTLKLIAVMFPVAIRAKHIAFCDLCQKFRNSESTKLADIAQLVSPCAMVKI